MTLDDFKSLQYENFFLAIIKRKKQWKENQKVSFKIPDYPSFSAIIDLLNITVKQKIIEKDKGLNNSSLVKEDAKQSKILNNKDGYPVILAKTENGYLDLSKMEKLDSAYQIICEIPINEYYRECDFSFEEDEEGPYLNIDVEPLRKFIKDYREGKI